MRFRTHVFLFVLLLGGVSDLAVASGLEKLLMPGRVIEGHADIEEDCEACHDRSSDRAVAELCTSCHEEVGADRTSRTGFHGRFDPARQNECIVCHTDHEGRDADIVAINAGLFDHRWTDFVLTGAHLVASCESCHLPEEGWSEAPAECVDCHRDDDAHRGGLGAECQDCHTSADWQNTTFDHSQTDYPLTGGHVDVACNDCHRDNNFLPTPQRCSSCHAVDDVHAGSNGDICSDCHSTSTWSGIRFDHDTTGFSLSGGHDRLQCTDCHKREDFKDAFIEACRDCHVVDDDHQGRNGNECESCHQPTVWPDTSFIHAATGFELAGAHVELACSTCHKEATMGQVEASCGDCHAIDDSHSGQLGNNCAACHEQTAWLPVTGFDHDLTGFPLTGLHSTVACGECHASNRFHDAASSCVACHAEDDPHGESLGDDCTSCHNTGNWTLTAFDHDLHTTFPLDGGHEVLACNACHSDASASAADVPSNCGGCHASDDVHNDQFGSRCDQCHSTSTWSDVDSLSGRRP